MKIKNIFSDVHFIEFENHNDDRGYFRENFNYKTLLKNQLDFTSVQDNFSFSKKKGTIRGLHFQTSPYQQAKIIYVLSGCIFDVFVDIRKDSSTFGQYGSVELNSENGYVFIPNGFAHGFCTLEDNTQVFYKVDNYYNIENDSGILWNDVDLGIEWPLDKGDYVLSEKDSTLQNFLQFKEGINLKS